MSAIKPSTPPARLRRGETFEGEIETLAYGGRGIARPGGYVVFVSGGLPGDRVLAEVTKSKRGYAEAVALELLAPSPDRLPNVDEHQGEACPGASWQGLAYEKQLAFKEAHVADALTRIGKLGDVNIDPIIGADEQWRYRNKVEYSFGEQDGELVLGFRPQGRWDEVLDIEDCHLSSEATNQARNEVLAWARAEGLNAYDPHDHRGILRNLIVREGRRTGQIQTRLVTSRETSPGRRSISTRSSTGPPARPRVRPARSAKRRCASGSSISTSSFRMTPSSRPTPRWRRSSTAWPPNTPT